MSGQTLCPFWPQNRKVFAVSMAEKKPWRRWSFLRCSFSDPGFVPQWYGDPTNDLLMVCRVCCECCMDVELLDVDLFV